MPSEPEISTGTSDASTASRCIEFGDDQWICMGPRMEEIRRDELGERWCFTCRTRRPFVFTVSVPVEPSYYGPSGGIECDQGHYDGDLFPGRSREWEEAS